MSDKPTYTYFIQGEEGGLIKIGRSVNVDDRCRSLQSGSPVKLKIIATSDENNESELHRKFKEYRRHGEWFEERNEIYDYILGRVDLSKEETEYIRARKDAISRASIAREEAEVIPAEVATDMEYVDWSVGTEDAFDELWKISRMGDDLQVCDYCEESDLEMCDRECQYSTWSDIVSLLSWNEAIDKVGMNHSRRFIWVFFKPMASLVRRMRLLEVVNVADDAEGLGWKILGSAVCGSKGLIRFDFSMFYLLSFRDVKEVEDYIHWLESPGSEDTLARALNRGI